MTISAPHAAVSEALRTIRAGILLSSADNPVRVVMVTSSKASEGKTTLSANLAVTLAQASYRTLLIDSDLRHPRASSYFGISASSVGLVHYLVGAADKTSIISDTAVPNLSVISPGAPSPNPAELVGSSKMNQLLKELSETFDYIVIDSPPVLPVADSLMLSRNVDGLIFVVRSGETERPAAKEAVRRLRRVAAPLLGVVVNGLAGSVKTYSIDNYSISSYRMPAPADTEHQLEERGHAVNG